MLKTNEYFYGKVKSIAFQTEILPATVGVMAPGDLFDVPADGKFAVKVVCETACFCLYG